MQQGCSLPADLQEEEAKKAEALLERWKEAGGEQRVARVLARYGYNLSHASLLLSEQIEGKPQDAAWLELLEEVLEETPAVYAQLFCQENRRTYPYLDCSAPLPFEELLVPFVVVGLRKMESNAGGAARALSDQARTRLCRALLSLLSHFALPTFESEFTLERNLEGVFPWGGSVQSNQGYRKFIGRLLQHDYGKLLAEYSVLARLLSSWTELWAKAQAQMLKRLHADWELLSRTLLEGHNEYLVVDIVPYCSDPHVEGESVAILYFSAGKQVVYKPRPLDMEQEFASLTQWVNQSGFPWPLYSARTLSRNGYGWMEFIPAADCKDRGEVETFYARCGGLLCLLFFLQGTDIHYENLIAKGSNPVLVDLETLFHPQPPVAILSALGPGAAEASQDCIDVLLQTGLLPRGEREEQNPQLDFSALGRRTSGETPFLITQCEGVNEDSMAVGWKHYRPTPGKNLPLLNGSQQTAELYIDALLDGFREMFALILSHRESFLACRGPLQRFAQKRGRFIARATNAYGLLLQESLQPRYMRNGASRGLCFERLFPSAASDSFSSACWPLWEEELRFLEQMTTPYFVTVSDEIPSVLCNSPDLGDASWRTPLEQVRLRIEQAREEDLPRYLTAIGAALSRV